MLKQGIFEPKRRDALLLTMHRVKEDLLQCDAAATALLQAIAGEKAAVTATGFKLEPGGRALERFPMVQDLDAKVTAFLIAARRVVMDVCEVPGHFGAGKHSSLSYVVAELAKQLGDENKLVRYLRGFEPTAKRVADLRHGQEHVATTDRPLHLRNFTHAPSNQLVEPCWAIGKEPFEPIAGALRQLPPALLDLAEGMFVGCVDQFAPEWPPFGLVAVENVDPKCPVQFELGFDPSKLFSTGHPEPGSQAGG